MLGWEVLGVSSALGDKATQYLNVSDSCSPPCREARAFLSGELGLPQEQRKTAKGEASCLPWALSKFGALLAGAEGCLCSMLLFLSFPSACFLL